jgi:hypothetical protein
MLATDLYDGHGAVGLTRPTCRSAQESSLEGGFAQMELFAGQHAIGVRFRRYLPGRSADESPESPEVQQVKNGEPASVPPPDRLGRIELTWRPTDVARPVWMRVPELPPCDESACAAVVRATANAAAGSVLWLVAEAFPAHWIPPHLRIVVPPHAGNGVTEASAVEAPVFVTYGDTVRAKGGWTWQMSEPDDHGRSEMRIRRGGEEKRIQVWSDLHIIEGFALGYVFIVEKEHELERMRLTLEPADEDPLGSDDGWERALAIASQAARDAGCSTEDLASIWSDNVDPMMQLGGGELTRRLGDAESEGGRERYMKVVEESYPPSGVWRFTINDRRFCEFLIGVYSRRVVHSVVGPSLEADPQRNSFGLGALGKGLGP